MIHNHNTEVFKEIIQDEEFSFHPYLADWFRKSFNLSNESLIAIEYGCDGDSCPIIETIIYVKDNENINLRIGRGKNLISKMDFQLSLQKQKKV